MKHDTILLLRIFVLFLLILGLNVSKTQSCNCNNDSKNQSQVKQISGKVIDEAGQPVTYANVVLYSLPDSMYIHGVSTDSDGCFLIPITVQKSYFIQINRIGYEKKQVTVSTYNLGIIQLKSDITSLNDVVVTASRKTIKLEHGKLVADIANSALSKEKSAVDILRKLPGMMTKGDELVTFTGTVPAIYINGKKIQSINEVKQLEVKNIKEVKLNNNPGSEYDASVSTVLEIITFDREDGFSLQIDGNLDRNHVWQHGEAIKANYNVGGLSAFASFGYNKYGKKAHQTIDNIISAQDTTWYNSTNIRTTYDMKLYSYSVGSNYDINKNHSIGIMYDGDVFTKDNKAPFSSDVLANNLSYSNINGQSSLKNKEEQHHINAFYSGNTGSLTFGVYADYVNLYLHRDQTVSEESLRYGQSNVNNTNYTKYNVYALSPKITYQINSMHQFKFGVDLSSVQGNNDLSYLGSLISNTKSKTDENKWAEYISYCFDNGAFSLDAGLRFESVKYQYKYNGLSDSPNNIDKRYNNLFPSLGISYKSNDINQSLNYRISTIRPMFEQLNNSSYYVNRFFYQEGNSTLIPQITHQIKYSFTYKFVYLSLGYDYNKNYIDAYFTTKQDNPEAFVSTVRNYDKQQRIFAVLNLQHRFHFFEPSLNVMFTKNFQDFEYLNQIVSNNKPIYQLSSYNCFYLPAKFIAKLEYQYKSGGNELFYAFNPTHMFSLSLSKSFLKDRLNVSLDGTDIFRNYIPVYDARINNIYFWQRDDEDFRKVSLSFTWRFNNYKKKYKGENAAVDELNRF